VHLSRRVRPVAAPGGRFPDSRQGGDLKPKDFTILNGAVKEARKAVPGVEVLFQ
jgi:hypothetical protein